MAIAETPVLMYHRIDADTSKGNKLVVSPQSFARQMHCLNKALYKVISLEELVKHLRNKTNVPRRSVVLTFDDGYKDNYTNAYPILKKYNFPAAIFLVSDWVGKEGFLSRDEINEMSRNGIDFGAHTLTHPNLPALSEEKCKEEIFVSREELEGKINRKIKFFAYPYGVVNRKVRDLVSEAGYEAAFAASFKQDSGITAPDIYAITRIRIAQSADSLFVFRLKVSGYYNKFRRLQKLTRHNV